MTTTDSLDHYSSLCPRSSLVPAAADTAKPLGRTAVTYGMAAAGSGLLTLLPSQLDIPDGHEVPVPVLTRRGCR